MATVPINAGMNGGGVGPGGYVPAHQQQTGGGVPLTVTDEVRARLLATGSAPVEDWLAALVVGPVDQVRTPHSSAAPGDTPFDRTVTTTGTLTAGQAMDRLTRMPDTVLAALQADLWQAGYYDTVRSGYATDKLAPSWRNLDEDTRAAFRLFLDDAIITRKPMDTLMAERKQAAAARAGADGGSGPRRANVGGANVYEVATSDPTAVAAVVEAVAEELLGRRATPQEREALVARITGAQADADRARNAAREGASRAAFDAGVAADDAAVAAASGGGSIINPVVQAEGAPADTMGAARDGGRRSHKGTDIFGPEGSPVVAPIGGTVVKAGDDGGNGGIRVWIRGDDGRFHYLAHLKSASVTEGARVEQGTPIGTVGRTGNARGTPAHVHYSINSKVGSEDAIGNPARELAAGGGRFSPAAGPASPDTYIAPTTVETTQVSPEGQARDHFATHAHGEVDAKEVADTYDTFISLIGGSRG